MNNEQIVVSYNGRMIDDRYKVVETLGSGAMSVVLKATDTLRRRPVALKLLSDELEYNDKALRRFANESKAAAMLSEEHIVKIFDVNLDHNPKYIVMEYVSKVNLKNYIDAHSPIEPHTAVSLIRQLLLALKATHEKNIVHRDVKPQNILITDDMKLKLTDFGISKLPGYDTLEEDDKAMGTVSYISPEQASGRDVSGESDIYSVGVILYEMLTGKLPFEGDTALSVAMMHVNNPPVLPRKYNEKIPVALEQIVMKAMSKDPRDRFSSAASMIKALDMWENSPDMVFDKETLDNIDSTSVELRTDADGKKKPEKIKTKHGRRTMFPIIFGVSCAFLVVFLIAGAIMGLSLLNLTKNNSLTVIMPDLTNREFNEQLQSELRDKNISVGEVEYIFDTSIPNGIIISQIPESGARKKIADNNHYVNLSLKVSKGSENIPVPDLNVTEYRKAIIILQEAELGYKIQQVYSPVIMDGYVISTDPAAGTPVAKNTEVTLFVSSGQELNFATMPDLSGKTLEEARELINASSLILGKLTREPSQEATGTVISQSVEAGTSVAKKYTVVDLVLSIKAPETTAPPETTVPASTQPEVTASAPISTAPFTSVPASSSAPETSAPASVTATRTAPPASTSVPASSSTPVTTAPVTSEAPSTSSDIPASSSESAEVTDPSASTVEPSVQSSGSPAAYTIEPAITGEAPGNG